LQGRREWRGRGFSVHTRLAAGLAGERTTPGLEARRRDWRRRRGDWGCAGVAEDGASGAETGGAKVES